MEEKDTQIGDNLAFNPFAFDEECYVERTFQLQTIRKEIFNKETPPFVLFISGATKQELESLGVASRKIHITDVKDVLGSNEQWINIPHERSRNKLEVLFKNLCRRHENAHTVHWLYLLNGVIVWKTCNGDMGDFIKYVDNKQNVISAPYTESKIINEKVVIIADSVGTGKSTLLNSIAKKLEKYSPEKRVFRFDLKSYAKVHDGMFCLKDVIFKSDENEEAIEFAAMMINFEHPLDKIEFKHSCRDSSQIILMFDGFDEISKAIQEKFLKLLKALKNGSQVSIWVTTRFDEKIDLEAVLGTLAYGLVPLTPKQRITFLGAFWKKKLTDLLTHDSQDPLGKIREYLKQVRSELETSFKSIENPNRKVQFLMFMNSVTQMISISMRGQVDGKDHTPAVLEKIGLVNFSAYVKILVKGVNSTNQRGEVAFTSVPLNLVLVGSVVFEEKFKMIRETNLYDLCEKFVEMKFEEYYKRKKRRPSLGNIYSSPEFFSYKQMTLESLLPEEVSSCPMSLSEKFDQELIEEIGLVEKTPNGFKFVHHTLAEYFFCEWVVSDLGNEEVQRVLVKKILGEPNYSAVRAFLDVQIEKKQAKINLTDKVIEETDFFGVDDSKGTFLHLLSYEGLGSILNMFLEAFPAKVADIALKTNSKMENFLHVACSRGWNAVIKVILNFAKTHMTKEAVEKMVLQKDDWGVSPFYGVGRKAFVESFVDFLYDNNGKIGEEVSSYLLDINLLPAETNFLRKTFLAKHADSFKKMLEVAFSKFSQDKYHELVVAQTDLNGNTCLHHLANVGRIDNLLQFWEYADKSMSADSLETYLQQKDGRGNTVLHQSALGSNAEAFHQFITLARLSINSPGSVCRFLSMVNAEGSTILHEAVSESKSEFLQQLCDVLDEELEREALKKFVVQPDGALNTILHLAVCRDEIDVMRQVCDHIKEVLNKESMREFLFAKNSEGFTPFHSCADKGSVDILRLLWGCAEELDKQSRREFITATNKNGDMVFHLAATRGKADLLKVFSEHALAILTKDSLKTVVKHGNNDGNTTFHLSALNELVDTPNYWFQFANFALEKNNKNGIKEALTKQNLQQESALHLAVKRGKPAVIQQICSHTKKKLEAEDFKEFLVGTDKSNNTIIHMAVTRGASEILKLVLEFVKSKLEYEAFREFLKKVNEDGDTIFHLGVRGGKLDILKQTFELVKDTLCESVIKDLLVRKNMLERTALQLAYDIGDFDVVKGLCDCAKTSLSVDSLLEFLTNINDYGETILHLVVHLEEMSEVKLWCSYFKDLLRVETIGKLFTIPNQNGDTVLHYVLRLRDSDITTQWFEFAREALTGNCLREVLEVTNGSGDSIIHLASSVGEIDVTKWLCEYLKEMQEKESLKKTLLKCNKNGDAVLHSVVRKCEMCVVKFWLDFAKDDLGEDFLAEIIQHVNSLGESVLHIAVVRNDVEIVKMLCDCAKIVLNKESMERFLTGRVKKGSNVLHFIVTKGDIIMLNAFWEYCVGAIDKEARESFLSHKNGGDENILQLAASRGKLSILNEVFIYLKDYMSSESIKEIMTKRSLEGNGILHSAASRGKFDIIVRLWEWSNEIMGKEYSDEFLTGTNSQGDTILHLAVSRSEIIFLKQLCEFGINNLSRESLTTLIMMPNREGSTCFHLATIHGETIIVNKLYDYAKSILNEKQLESFFKKTNDKKDTVLHICVRGGKMSTSMYLCKYAKDIMSSESLRRLLTRPNSNGKTVCDEALLGGRNCYVESLWEYANQVTEAERRENEYKHRRASRGINWCCTY